MHFQVGDDVCIFLEGLALINPAEALKLEARFSSRILRASLSRLHRWTMHRVFQSSPTRVSFFFLSLFSFFFLSEVTYHVGARTSPTPNAAFCRLHLAVTSSTPLDACAGWRRTDTGTDIDTDIDMPLAAVDASAAPRTCPRIRRPVARFDPSRDGNAAAQPALTPCDVPSEASEASVVDAAVTLDLYNLVGCLDYLVAFDVLAACLRRSWSAGDRFCAYFHDERVWYSGRVLRVSEGASPWQSLQIRYDCESESQLCACGSFFSPL